MNPAVIAILTLCAAAPEAAPVSAESLSPPPLLPIDAELTKPLSPPPLLNADVDLPEDPLTEWDRQRTAALFARVAVGGELAPTGSTRPEDSAKEVWAGRCAHCHGSDGQARGLARRDGARDLAQLDWQNHRTDAQIAAVIEKGVHDSRMKGFRVALTREQITALVAYIRDFKSQASMTNIAFARN